MTGIAHLYNPGPVPGKRGARMGEGTANAFVIDGAKSLRLRFSRW